MSAKKPNVERNVTINKSEFKAAVVKHLHCTLGTDENKANNHAWWKATCSAMQEQVLEGIRKTQKTHYLNDTRAVHYFSAEFLMGRLLSNNLQNFGLFEYLSLTRLKVIAPSPSLPLLRRSASFGDGSAEPVRLAG